MSATKWFGTTPEMRSNHQAERRVRTSPLRGMAVGSTTSNAEMRSVATMSRWSPRSYVSRTLPRAKRLGRSDSSMRSDIATRLELQVEESGRRGEPRCDGNHDGPGDNDANRAHGERGGAAGIRR